LSPHCHKSEIKGQAPVGKLAGGVAVLAFEEATDTERRICGWVLRKPQETDRPVRSCKRFSRVLLELERARHSCGERVRGEGSCVGRGVAYAGAAGGTSELPMLEISGAEAQQEVTPAVEILTTSGEFEDLAQHLVVLDGIRFPSRNIASRLSGTNGDIWSC